MKGMTRFRRQMVATGAALGVAAAVVGTAAAADQVNYDHRPVGVLAAAGHHRGPGRQPVVRRPRRPVDRQDAARRLAAADPGARRRRPGGHHQRPGRSTLVHGVRTTDRWFTGLQRHGQQDRPTGGITVTPATLEPDALNLQGITTGADGNLWYLGQGHTTALWRVSGAARRRRSACGRPPCSNAQSVARGPGRRPEHLRHDGPAASSTHEHGRARAPTQIAPLAQRLRDRARPRRQPLGHPPRRRRAHRAERRRPSVGRRRAPGQRLPRRRGRPRRGAVVRPVRGRHGRRRHDERPVPRIPVPGCDGPEGIAAGLRTARST